MKKEDPLQQAQERLEALRLEEKRLQQQLRDTGQRIREGATPSGLLRNAVSGVFQNRGTAAETAKAALGIGAGLVLNNLTRKQRRLCMIGKFTGLALGALITGLAERKRRKSGSRTSADKLGKPH